MQEPSLGEEDRSSLRELLTTGSPVLKFLGDLERQIRDKERAIATTPLFTEENRLKVIQDQGVVKGLMQAVQILLDAAEERNEDYE